MNKSIVYAAAFLAIASTGAAQAATVVTGGRCTQKQLSNKHTQCETSMFTNKAGQSGYKCTCSDRRVVLQPELDPTQLSPSESDPPVRAAAQRRLTRPL